MCNMCKFCEEFIFLKNLYKKTDEESNTSHKIFVRISIYGWKKGQRRIKGTQSSQTIYKAHNLKYCPMCGRKLV